MSALRHNEKAPGESQGLDTLRLHGLLASEVLEVHFHGAAGERAGKGSLDVVLAAVGQNHHAEDVTGGIAGAAEGEHVGVRGSRIGAGLRGAFLVGELEAGGGYSCLGRNDDGHAAVDVAACAEGAEVTDGRGALGEILVVEPVVGTVCESHGKPPYATALSLRSETL